MDQISIFYIDDHPMIIQGLKVALEFYEPRIQIIGYANSMKRSIPEITRLQPTMILLDLFMQNTFPVDNLRELRGMFPKIPVVIYTMEERAPWMRKMMAEGARGYITKTKEDAEIASMILSVAAGGTVFPEEVNALNNFHKKYTDNKLFTEIEIEIALFLASGYTIYQTAIELGRSKRLVDLNLQCMRYKLKAKSNSELIHVLTRMGEI